MTNAELISLLREARDFMRQAAISRGPCPDCTECDHRDAIIAKADAALAAHDAVPPSEEKVEWKTEMGLHATTINGVNIAVFPMTENGKWTAALHVATPFDTLDEAKSAAIAAARGMK